LIRALLTQVAAAFRRTALPLASYYAVTLAVPLANGAARSGDAFVEHALVVLIVPPIGIVLASTVHLMVRAATNAGASRRAARGPKSQARQSRAVETDYPPQTRAGVGSRARNP